MNMLVKPMEGREYVLTDFIATEFGKERAERYIMNNEVLKGYKFVPKHEIDFSWWSKCFKKLTPKAIRRTEGYDIDWYGNVKEVK